MSYLALKRRRDLRRQRRQFAAVALVMTFGALTFGASYDAHQNLTVSYEGTYERLAFADVTIDGVGPQVATTLAALDGVAATTIRRQADVPMRIGDRGLVGRVVEMPLDGPPAVGRVDVERGDDLSPSEPYGVLVETHTADWFALEPGDTLEVLTKGGLLELTVRGVAVSPEYLWPARSRQEIFPPPGTFAVVFAGPAVVDRLPPTGVVDQVLVRYADGVDRDALDAAVERLAAAADAAQVVPKAEQASNQALQLDVQGFAQMAVLFPLLFFVAAGMATAILLTRLVLAQRIEIGTLRANGVDRRRIATHYLGYGLVPGTVAAVVGGLLGMAGGWVTTGLYTSALGIPDTIRQLRPLTPLVAVAFGVLTGGAAAWVPARMAAGLQPAEAMRGSAGPAPGRHSLVERLVPPLRRLPVRWRTVLRGLGRNPRRSLATMTGIVLALVLLLASGGMIDTVEVLVRLQFEEIQLHDAVVAYVRPVSDADAEAVAAVPGVAEAGVVYGLPVTVTSGGRRYATLLQSFPATSGLHGYRLVAGDTAGGAVAGRALADLLGVSVGDPVTISFPGLGTSVALPLVGLVDEPVGTFVYVDRSLLERRLAVAEPPVPPEVLAAPTVATVYARFLPGVDRAEVLDRLGELPGAVAVIDARALFELIDAELALFYVFVGVMLVLGGAMAFSLIFITISVNVAEREVEYATMRANGVPVRRIAALFAGENLLLALAGIAPGLVVGYWAAWVMMRSYSTDMFNFDLRMRPATPILAALAVLGVAVLSLWPAIRTVRRIDVAGVVRQRSL